MRIYARLGTVHVQKCGIAYFNGAEEIHRQHHGAGCQREFTLSRCPLLGVNLVYAIEGLSRTVRFVWEAFLNVVLATAGDPRKLYETPSTFTNPAHPKVYKAAQAHRLHSAGGSRTAPFQNWGHVVRAVPVFAL